MKRTWLQMFVVASMLLLLAGCASRVAAPESVDTAMKEFPVRPDAAAIYVYRTAYDRRERGTTLYMDGRLVGNPRAATYFRLDAVPGRHVLHGASIDVGELAIYARPGSIYFVRLDVIGGHSHFTVERDDVARAQIQSCCRMLNATPG
jgi:hypothetical protein